MPAIPGVTEFAFGRLVNPTREGPLLAVTDEGHLLVTVRGEILARTDTVLLCSENLAVYPVQRRMRGRPSGEVFGRLVALAGEGQLLLAREHETFVTIMLQRDLCFFVEGFVWALEMTLLCDVGFVPRSGHLIQLLRVSGEGAVALRVPGSITTVKIAPDRGYRIHRHGFVGWVGDVVPRFEPDGEFVYLEGEGAVFVCFSAGIRPHAGANYAPTLGPAALAAP